MVDKVALNEKREMLKSALAAREYKTLADVILEGTSRFIQKLTRNSKPISFWYSGLVLALVSLIVPYLVSIFRKETLPPDLFVGQIWITAMALSMLFGVKLGVSILFRAFQESILNAIESVSDFNDLQSWLATKFNTKNQLSASIVISLIGFLFGNIPMIFFLSLLKITFIGPHIFLIILWIPISTWVYNFLLMFLLSARLRRYRFRLYFLNPSSSEAIEHLAETQNKLLYVIAGTAVVWTLGLALLPGFELFTAFFSFVGPILIVWVPLIAFFINNQYTLGQIIRRAKRKTLNEIRSKVEKIEIEGDITDKDTIESIKRLNEYHDQIRGTRNSALDIRAGLNFLNSLLLPLLAFLLGNLDNVIKLFRFPTTP